MAELALFAFIVQIVDVGCRLSLRLYTFGESVASADRAILTVSKDVSLTCTVLQELGSVLKNDTSNITSKNAVHTAEKVVQECLGVFQEMDELLLNKMPQLRLDGGDKKARAKRMLERLRWPTIKGKIELLSCNLDRMKSTLTLMLNVIIFAQQLAARNTPHATLDDQRNMVMVLAHLTDERERLYKSAQMALEPDKSAGAADHDDRVRSSRIHTNLVMLPDQPKTQFEAHKGSDADSSLSQVATLAEDISTVNELLQDYTRLKSSLLREIRSSTYDVALIYRAELEDRVSQAHERHCRRIEDPCLDRCEIVPAQFDCLLDPSPVKDNLGGLNFLAAANTSSAMLEKDRKSILEGKLYEEIPADKAPNDHAKSLRDRKKTNRREMIYDENDMTASERPLNEKRPASTIHRIHAQHRRDQNAPAPLPNPFDLDTSLDDMTGIIDNDTSSHKRDFSAWNTPDSWAVRPSCSIETYGSDRRFRAGSSAGAVRSLTRGTNIKTHVEELSGAPAAKDVMGSAVEAVPLVCQKMPSMSLEHSPRPKAKKNIRFGAARRATAIPAALVPRERGHDDDNDEEVESDPDPDQDADYFATIDMVDHYLQAWTTCLDPPPPPGEQPLPSNRSDHNDNDNDNDADDGNDQPADKNAASPPPPEDDIPRQIS